MFLKTIVWTGSRRGLRPINLMTLIKMNMLTGKVPQIHQRQHPYSPPLSRRLNYCFCCSLIRRFGKSVNAYPLPSFMSIILVFGLVEVSRCLLVFGCRLKNNLRSLGCWSGCRSLAFMLLMFTRLTRLRLAGMLLLIYLQFLVPSMQRIGASLHLDHHQDH